MRRASVVVARNLCCTLCCPLHDRPDGSLGDVDEWLLGTDVFGVLLPVDRTLNVPRKVGITGLSTTTRRIFPPRDPEPVVLSTRSSLHVLRRDLRDLERSKSDVAAKLIHGIVAMVHCGPAKLLEFRYERHGNRNSVERVFREIKRRTPSFSNCFSNARATTADQWLKSFAFAWSQLI